VKTIAWFKDEDLEATLPGEAKGVLVRAAASYHPRTGPAQLRSSRLE